MKKSYQIEKGRTLSDEQIIFRIITHFTFGGAVRSETKFGLIGSGYGTILDFFFLF
jgi:hypothetical protein